mmetsp:Transcript_106339/g.310928  ORF Transcript_106339/g.310928 Transcript_106339/m.310928 type:complete len:432 (-) Transcript_106339:1304-2599(-)
MCQLRSPQTPASSGPSAGKTRDAPACEGCSTRDLSPSSQIWNLSHLFSPSTSMVSQTPGSVSIISIGLSHSEKEPTMQYARSGTAAASSSPPPAGQKATGAMRCTGEAVCSWDARPRSALTTALAKVPLKPKLLMQDMVPVQGGECWQGSVTKSRLRSSSRMLWFSSLSTLLAPSISSEASASTLSSAKSPEAAWPLPVIALLAVSGSTSSSKSWGRAFAAAPASTASRRARPEAWHSTAAMFARATPPSEAALSMATSMLIPAACVRLAPFPLLVQMATDLRSPRLRAPGSSSSSFASGGLAEASSTAAAPSPLTIPEAHWSKQKHLPSRVMSPLAEKAMKPQAVRFQALPTTTEKAGGFGSHAPWPCASCLPCCACASCSATSEEEPSVSTAQQKPSKPRTQAILLASMGSTARSPGGSTPPGKRPVPP